MSQAIVECVPNFSEGRDRKKIDQIVAAMAEVEGVSVLDVDPGQETNRTVVTLVGPPAAVSEAAFRGIGKAAEVIDMSRHQGAHARHGATDVCPFVPVSGIDMDGCVELAHALGRRVGEELGIPVYLYDRAATTPQRRSLADVRAGEYEALPEKLKRPEWQPDFGPATFLPKTGVVTIGAREFLIAYNVNLNSRDKSHAADIASELREKGRGMRDNFKNAYYSSGELVKYRPSEGFFPSAYDDFVGSTLEELERHYRDEHGLDLTAELEAAGLDPKNLEGKTVRRPGLFAECRAVGWLIPEYGRAQISINLTDFKVTNMHDVFEASRDLADERGLVVTGSEIVGLVPFEAIEQVGAYYLAAQGSSRGLPASDVVETAVQSLGLRDVGAFDAATSVLGMPKADGPLASMTLTAFADEVSRPTPAPGGGSIAALAAALGASLAAMVANLSFAKKGLEEHQGEMEEIAVTAQSVKIDLLRAIDADTDAFNDVIAARRLPKRTAEEEAARDQAIQEGFKKATSVPLATANLAVEAMRLARRAAEHGMEASVTDAGVGVLMGRAAALGAIDNVRINLGSITDADWVAEVRSQLGAIAAEADRIELEMRALVDRRIG